MGEIVGSAVKRASKILAEHHVALELRIDLPLVAVDAVLFEQALFNLIDNAAKFAPSGTEIRIRGRIHGAVVRLSIMDEGPGIAPEDLERIFDKFHRAEKQDKVRPGTGLGLGISRGFIEAMGGSLTATNRTDRTGAFFEIRLPVPSQPVQEVPS